MKTLPVHPPIYQGNEFNPGNEAAAIRDLKNQLHSFGDSKTPPYKEEVIFIDTKGAYFPKGSTFIIESFHYHHSKVFLTFSDGLSIEFTKDILIEGFLRIAMFQGQQLVWEAPLYDTSGPIPNEQQEFFQRNWIAYSDITMLRLRDTSLLRAGDVLYFYLEDANEGNWMALVLPPNSQGKAWCLNSKGYPERIGVDFIDTPIYFYRYI